MEEKYNLNSISKAFEKLFNAGFNTSKKIATLDIKEVRKIPNLTMSDFYIISDLWELVKKNNNKTSQLFIEFLSGYKEKGNEEIIYEQLTTINQEIMEQFNEENEKGRFINTIPQTTSTIPEDIQSDKQCNQSIK